MPAIAWSRRTSALDAAWGVFVALCIVAMRLWPEWEPVPFHLIWAALILVYGFRVWPPLITTGVLTILTSLCAAMILLDGFHGDQLLHRLSELPLLVAIFLAMAWHARRRAQAMDTIATLADERAALLEQEERLLQNVSHELRTPVTIARGHLEVLDRQLGRGRPELAVAFDELSRIEQIVDRLLLLARAERDDFLQLRYVDLVPFLEETFMRWAEVAPRAWRLGGVINSAVLADEAWLRAALDALLENAVHYTDDYARIELSAHGEMDAVVIEVEDEGHGIPPEAAAQIFERFARSDMSRTRREGGAGLGLAIVDAIARAHGGSVSAHTLASGSRFALRLPLDRAVNADSEEAPDAGNAVPAFETA